MTHIRTELERKGYTKDSVVVHCCVCQKPVTCKWSRNKTPGMNFGRPLIELPEDWKVIMTYGFTKQDVCCPDCTIEEKTTSIHYGNLPT
jgi:hypothetical protein